jgi:hypothetical protein
MKSKLLLSLSLLTTSASMTPQVPPKPIVGYFRPRPIGCMTPPDPTTLAAVQEVVKAAKRAANINLLRGLGFYATAVGAVAYGCYKKINNLDLVAEQKAQEVEKILDEIYRERDREINRERDRAIYREIDREAKKYWEDREREKKLKASVIEQTPVKTIIPAEGSEKNPDAANGNGLAGIFDVKKADSDNLKEHSNLPTTKTASIIEKIKQSSIPSSDNDRSGSNVAPTHWQNIVTNAKSVLTSVRTNVAYAYGSCTLANITSVVTSTPAFIGKHKGETALAIGVTTAVGVLAYKYSGKIFGKAKLEAQLKVANAAKAAAAAKLEADKKAAAAPRTFRKACRG